MTHLAASPAFRGLTLGSPEGRKRVGTLVNTASKCHSPMEGGYPHGTPSDSAAQRTPTAAPREGSVADNVHQASGTTGVLRDERVNFAREAETSSTFDFLGGQVDVLGLG